MHCLFVGASRNIAIIGVTTRNVHMLSVRCAFAPLFAANAPSRCWWHHGMLRYASCTSHRGAGLFPRVQSPGVSPWTATTDSNPRSARHCSRHCGESRQAALGAQVFHAWGEPSHTAAARQPRATLRGTPLAERMNASLLRQGASLKVLKKRSAWHCCTLRALAAPRLLVPVAPCSR